jgi:hypothetical protein
MDVINEIVSWSFCIRWRYRILLNKVTYYKSEIRGFGGWSDSPVSASQNHPTPKGYLYCPEEQMSMFLQCRQAIEGSIGSG